MREGRNHPSLAPAAASHRQLQRAPKRRIRGVVRSLATNIAVYAKVTAASGTTWTEPDSGRFSLVTDSSELTISALGYHTTLVAVGADTIQDDVIVLLDPSETMRVAVRTSAGEPVAAAQVCILTTTGESHWLQENYLGETLSDGSLTAASSGGAQLLIARTSAHASQPTWCQGAEATIVCDNSTSGTIAVVDADEQRVAHVVDLTFLAVQPGRVLRVGVPTRGLAIPSGVYVVRPVGHKSLQGLPPAPDGEGNVLTLSAGATVELSVAGGAVAIAIQDATSHQPVIATVALDVLQLDGWQVLGETVTTGPEGVADITGLVSRSIGIRADYRRLRFGAPGYNDRSYDLNALTSGDTVRLASVRDKVRLMLERDGGPYVGCIVVRQAADPDSIGPLVYDGLIDAKGIELAVAAGSRLEIYPSRSHRSGRLATVVTPPADGTEGPVLRVPLPSSCRIRLVNPQSIASVAAQRSDGQIFPVCFNADNGVASISDLFPGSYRVGIVHALSVSAKSEAIVEVELAEGADVAVPWSQEWRAPSLMKGQITASDARANLDSLRVLPWSGAAPNMNLGVYQQAAPVSRDGRFEVWVSGSAFERLAIYNVLPGTSPMLLGEFAAGEQLRVNGRRIYMDISDLSDRAAFVFLAGVINALGKSPGQWRVPCSTQQTLDLGIIPVEIQSASLIVGAKSRKVTLPAQSGSVGVAVAK
jgi:hypothetical protein